MGKSVLVSIQPQYCELIANAVKPLIFSKIKRLELRKSKPNLDVPFKAYIYETKALFYPQGSKYLFQGQGKVIGEFVCDYILGHCEMANADIAEQQGCVKREDILNYANGKEVFGWHISNLVIYDKPKELSVFKMGCKGCKNKDTYHCKFHCMGEREMKRPPQSWCYVEELK